MHLYTRKTKQADCWQSSHVQMFPNHMLTLWYLCQFMVMNVQAAESNYTENCYWVIKPYTSRVLHWMGAPSNTWLYSILMVVFYLNHFVNPTLVDGTKSPIMITTFEPGVTSQFLYFHFCQPFYYLQDTSETLFPWTSAYYLNPYGWIRRSCLPLPGVLPQWSQHCKPMRGSYHWSHSCQSCSPHQRQTQLFVQTAPTSSLLPNQILLLLAYWYWNKRWMLTPH